MNSVMKKLQLDLLKSVQSTLEVSQKIQSLKWKEGSALEVQRIRSTKNERGQKVNGRRSLKPYRRPETGTERSRLWLEKRGYGYYTREYLLLWAMLRGKAYSKVEAKCKDGNFPSAFGLHQLLGKYLKDTNYSIEVEGITEWLDGGPAPQLIGEAA